VTSHPLEEHHVDSRRRTALQIHDFLLVYVLGDTTDPDTRAHAVGDLDPEPSGLNGIPPAATSLRSAVAQHRERTMTVVFPGQIEAITRCGICPKEETRPCRALRILALPYAQHPAYRPEWRIAPPVIAKEDAGRGNGALSVLPQQRASDLPPPGNARRRILRECGIRSSRLDFTDEEPARRGTIFETPAAGPPV
jgi:hypothetical protein